MGKRITEAQRTKADLLGVVVHGGDFPQPTGRYVYWASKFNPAKNRSDFLTSVHNTMHDGRAKIFSSIDELLNAVAEPEKYEVEWR